MYELQNDIQMQFLNDIRDCGMSLIFRQFEARDLDVFDKYENYIKEDYKQDEYIDAITSCETALNCNTLTPDLLLLILGQFAPLLVYKVEEEKEKEPHTCTCDCYTKKKTSIDFINEVLCQQELVRCRNNDFISQLRAMNPSCVDSEQVPSLCSCVMQNGLSMLACLLENPYPIDKEKIIEVTGNKDISHINYNSLVDSYDKLTKNFRTLSLYKSTENAIQKLFQDELYNIVIIAAIIYLQYQGVLA